MSDFDMNDLAGTDAYAGGGSVKPDAGDYTVMISKSDTSANAKGNGTNIAMEYTVLDGQFQGTVLKEWLAVVNPSAQSQEIARSKLKALQVVSNSQNERRPEALTGKTIIIRITKEPHQFVNDRGTKVNTFNNNVINYMNLKRVNAAGKEVPAFVAQAQTEQTSPASQSSSSSNNGDSQAARQSRKDLDDEIPF